MAIDVPESKNKIWVSWAALFALAASIWALSSTYWNIHRNAHRIDAKTDRLEREYQKDLQHQREVFDLKLELVRLECKKD